MREEAQESFRAALHEQAVDVLAFWEPDCLSKRDRLREGLDEAAPSRVRVCPEEDLTETCNKAGEVGRKILNSGDADACESD